MFLTGPAVVREVMGEDVTAAELGGHKVHERNGVATSSPADDADAALLVRDLLDHLPASTGERAAALALGRARPARPGRARCRTDERRVYDVRDVIARRSSTAAACSSARRAGRATSSAASRRLDGRAVGVVANQPRYLGGVLDAESGTKGARFVRTCNAFGLPLVVLVDTPGFMPGTKQEQRRRDPPRREARARVRRGRRCRR